MTRLQLISAVAEATGESRRTIRALGFSLEPRDRALRPPDALRLSVACPHCRRPVAYPGTTRSGAPILAECLDCDALFHAAPTAVFTAGRRVVRCAPWGRCGQRRLQICE